MHKQKHPLAGKKVSIKSAATHPYHEEFGGQSVSVMDWNDRIIKMPWREHMHKKAEAILLRRVEASGSGSLPLIPDDDEVVRCKLGKVEVLIHVAELEADIPEVEVQDDEPAAEDKTEPKKKAKKKSK